VKHLLLATVRVYWAVWPRHLNRGCIYRETCSHNVHRVASDSGFVAGCRALLYRLRTCRPGYAVTTSAEGELGLLMRDGSFLPEHLVAEDILALTHRTIADLEHRFSSNSRKS